MATPSRPAVPVGTALAWLLLLGAAPTPEAAWHQLQRGAAAADPLAPLLGLVALVAWAAVSWLSLTVVVTVGGRLPGLVGRSCAAVSRRVAPAAVRRGVEVALGLTVAVGALGASPALASTGSSGGAASPPPAASLDWPGADVETPPSPVAPPPPAPAPQVVVRPGDTLWDLAEQDLAARRGAAPTEVEVARAWPSWWAANRDAVGDDPHLIRPGTPLSPPRFP